MEQREELRFDGRVAIVTGSGRGLGRAYARLLAERGASVVVNDLGVNVDGTDAGEDRAGSVVAEIEASGGTAIPNRDTVATPEGGRAIVEAAISNFGKVDIVVHNAGPIGAASFGELSEADLDLYLNGHLRGAFNVARPAWRDMLERGYGRIVFTSSQSVLGVPGTSPYAAAKGGIIGLTNALAAEGADMGIKVNAVFPSANTSGTQGMGNELFAKWFEAFRPELVAPAVAFMVHESCPWNGQKIVAAAGHVARLFLATTKGVFFENLTVEDVADAVTDIGDESKGYTASASAMEDLAHMQEYIPLPKSGGLAWS